MINSQGRRTAICGHNLFMQTTINNDGFSDMGNGIIMCLSIKKKNKKNEKKCFLKESKGLDIRWVTNKAYALLKVMFLFTGIM